MTARKASPLRVGQTVAATRQLRQQFVRRGKLAWVGVVTGVSRDGRQVYVRRFGGKSSQPFAVSFWVPVFPPQMSLVDGAGI